MSNITRELDQMIESNISELITLEEADKIVSVLGLFLEHTGGFFCLFLDGVPESILPYPKYLLVGALVKMLNYHHKNRNYEARDNLEKILFVFLNRYIDDKEAIQRNAEKFNNTELYNSYFSQLPKLQISRMEDGYLIDGELWQFSSSRIEEIKNSLNIEV